MASITPSTAIPATTRPPITDTLRRVATALVIAAILLAPFGLSDFRLALLGRFLCYAIVAIGIDLIWGYTGILSLGHGVYFGLGGYCMAMYLKLEATKGAMPDFMAWSGVDTMPWFWLPFKSLPFALGAAILAPALLAAAIGYCTFRSRIKGVFFSILSQALSIVVVTLFIGQQGYTGGTNGMTNYKTLLGHDLNALPTQHFFYWFTAVAVVAVYFAARWLVAGRMGKILIAIRDGENRARFIGYDPGVYKGFVYALSAALAGFAGVLFVLQVGLITPTEMDIVHSIKMVLWVAIGGRATLVGAVLGAVLVNGSENLLSENYPATWSYLMGGMFLASVLFMPQGIVGLATDLWQQVQQRRWSHDRASNSASSVTTTQRLTPTRDIGGEPADNPGY